MNTIWILSILGIITNLSDLITTYIALKNTNSFEYNKFLRFLFNKLGDWTYLIKLIFGTWIFLPLKYCPAYYVPANLLIYLWVLWGALIIFFIYCTINNILGYVKNNKKLF